MRHLCRMTEQTFYATEFVTGTNYFKLAESLGGVKSLLCHPAQMTHKTIPAERRRAAGVADSLVRLSVGLEEVEDLIADLEQTFQKIKTKEKNLVTSVNA